MTDEEIRKLARLARLQLREDEVLHLGPQIEQILAFASRLSELDLEGVPPMSTALDVTNRWRTDEVYPGLDRQDALAGAPRHDGTCFLVPPVLGPPVLGHPPADR